MPSLGGRDGVERGRGYDPPAPSCSIGPERASILSLAVADCRWLVHPLVALERGLGANLDIGADVIELEVVGVGCAGVLLLGSSGWKRQIRDEERAREDRLRCS